MTAEPQFALSLGPAASVSTTMATTSGLSSVYTTNNQIVDTSTYYPATSSYRPSPHYRRHDLLTPSPRPPVRSVSASYSASTAPVLPSCVTAQQAQTALYPLPVTPPSDRVRRTTGEGVVSASEASYSTARSFDARSCEASISSMCSTLQHSLSHTFSVRQSGKGSTR